MLDEPLLAPWAAVLAAARWRAPDLACGSVPGAPEPVDAVVVVVVAPGDAAGGDEVVVTPPDFARVPTAALVGVTAADPAGGLEVVGVAGGAEGELAVVVGVTGVDDDPAGGTSVEALQIWA